MDYSIGDTIVYTSGSRRIVLVDDKDPDIKNGESGFGGIVTEGPDKGMSVWGYDSQIEDVF
jgi:hypothetical protein